MSRQVATTTLSHRTGAYPGSPGKGVSDQRPYRSCGWREAKQGPLPHQVHKVGTQSTGYLPALCTVQNQTGLELISGGHSEPPSPGTHGGWVTLNRDRGPAGDTVTARHDRPARLAPPSSRLYVVTAGHSTVTITRAHAQQWRRRPFRGCQTLSGAADIWAGATCAVTRGLVNQDRQWFLFVG